VSGVQLEGYVLLQGRLVRADRARVSVFDRGFQYGDALIETLRIDRGGIIALEPHLARLTASARALGIPLPECDWARDIGRLIERNGLATSEAWARITLTRGVGPRGLLPPTVATPTRVVSCGRIDPGLLEARRRGVAVIRLGFGRGAALGEHKHPFYMPSIVGKEMAAARGAFDGLFIAAGAVQGATTANLFAVVGEELIAATGAGVLPGVTRARALTAAQALGMKVGRRRLAPSTLVSAREVFLTNSLFEVVPVVRVDGIRVGSGRPGPWCRRLQAILLGESIR